MQSSEGFRPFQPQGVRIPLEKVGVRGSGRRPGERRLNLVRPLTGLPNFQQFEPGGTGTPGLGGGDRRGNLFSLARPVHPFEARIHEFLEQDWSSERLRIVSPSYRMFQYLMHSYKTDLKGFDTGDLIKPNIPESASPEVIERMGNLVGQMAIALGILAYPQWEAKLQRKFRNNLPTAGYTFFCEEFQQQYWQKDKPIDYEREEGHDHFVKLPEAGRQLLKHICNVVGIPYDTQQDTFYFHAVLNKSEPIIQEE
jgi:hypothetical protein